MADGSKDTVFPHTEVRAEIGVLVDAISYIFAAIVAKCFSIRVEVDGATATLACDSPAVVRPVVDLHKMNRELPRRIYGGAQGNSVAGVLGGAKMRVCA